jgi:hypothetical protein
MLSYEECKRILNRNGKNYTDDQISNIRELLWSLAQLEVKSIEINRTDENSSNNESGK